MRPKQWTKNTLIYAGLVFDGQLFVLESFLRVTFGFVLLCLIASSIYIINDLVDIESDRLDPRKKYRPIASGRLSIRAATIAGIVIPVSSLAIATNLGFRFAIVLIGYFLLHIFYSFFLKHIVLLDILAITAGFVLRVAGGVVVIQVAQFSPWLYTCTALLALFLAVGKRRQELIILAESASDVRPTYKKYNLSLLDDMLRMVTTGTLIAYILYTIEVPSRSLAGTNLSLLTVPFVLYALLRYLYLIHVEGEGSAPEEVLLKDHPLQIAIMLWGLSFIFILYVLK